MLVNSVFVLVAALTGLSVYVWLPWVVDGVGVGGASVGGAPSLEASPEVTLQHPGNRPFRVLQFADVHFGDVRTDTCLNWAWHKTACSARDTTDFLNRLIQAERPDLLVFSGDQLAASAEPLLSLRTLYVPAMAANVPFVTINGNHDVEAGSAWSAQELRAYSSSVALLTGQGAVHVAQAENKLFTLWFFDYPDRDESSRGYSPVPDVTCADCGYRWISRDSVRWFVNRSTKLRSAGIAFMHVPLPEFSHPADEGTVVDGEQNEGVHSPAYDAGLFDAFVKSGRIAAVAAGHEHVNDFCKTVQGVTLCYSGVSGYMAYAAVDFHRRARVFELNADGTTSTYKRLDDSELSIVDRRDL